MPRSGHCAVDGRSGSSPGQVITVLAAETKTTSLDFPAGSYAGGSIAVGGQLTNDSTRINTGALNNDGTLINTGTLTTTGTLTNTGTLTLAAGTLAVGNGYTSGELIGNVLNNAILSFNRSDNSVYAGVISGTGNVEKLGAGTLTLSGANSFSGATIINAGTLEMGATNVLAPQTAVQLNNFATWNLNGYNQSVGSLISTAGYASVNLGSATLTVGNDNTDSESRATISGTGGSIVKNGTGRFTLAGYNSSYTGGVTLNAGTLELSDSAAGTGTLTINGGTLATRGIVTNPVQINHHFSAERTKLHGDIALGADIHILALPKAGGRTMVELGGSLSGTHSLTLETSTSDTEFNFMGSASNAYSGTTTVQGNGIVSLERTAGTTVIPGNLLITGHSVLGVMNSEQISNSSQVTVNSTGQNLYGSTLPYEGLALLSNMVETIGSLYGNGSVGLGTGTLRVGSGAFTGTIVNGDMLALKQGVPGAGKLEKYGNGTLVLSGANTYSGGTTVSGGTLVAGSNQALGTGNVTVANTAALEVSGGVTLAVGGNLNFQPGSTYRVSADPTGNHSSRIDVTGTATVTDGNVLHVGPQGNLAIAKRYTILHAAGGVTGRFATVASDYAYLNPTLSYTATEVQLQLQRKASSTGSGSMAFGELATTPNQAAVATSVDSLASNSPLHQYVLSLPSEAPSALFNSLAGDLHAQAGAVGQQLATLAPSISQQHLHSNLTAGMNSGAAVAQSDGPLPPSAWPSSKALPAWAEVVGHWQRYDGDGNAATLKQRTTGLFLGMDQEVGTSGWRLGGSLGYTNADGKVTDRASESDVNSYSAAVYGGKSFGTGVGPRINVLGGLAYTWHDIETTRRVTSLGQTLKADYSAHTAQLFAEVGYAIGQYDKFGFEPFVGVSLGQQRTKGFQETGGFAALQGRSSTDDLASTTLGLRMHSDFQVAGKDARLRATVGWRHAFGDVTAEKTMAFEGGQNFTVAGAPLARNTAVLGLEGEVALSRTAALVLGYRGELGSGQRDHAANVKLRWAF